MNYIKNFKNYDSTNESMAFLAAGGPAIGLLLWYGLMYGYVKISNLFNFIAFKRAISKIEPIFNKIKDDSRMMELITELGELKDGLYFGEEEGSNPRRTQAFQVRDSIYQRAKELLDENEYKTFVSAAKEFESGSEKPGAYFTDKDAEFKGWDYTV
jgi:hypothetical protein